MGNTNKGKFWITNLKFLIDFYFSIDQKAADTAAELSPLKQTGSAVVFAPKAEKFRSQFVMDKAEAVVGKL